MASKTFIETEGIQFVGIGKLMFDVQEDWNIPQLHFLTTKEDNYIEAVNLELQLFSTGKNEEEAIANLISLTVQHIKTVMANPEAGFKQLVEDVKSCVLEQYWSKYRELEFIAASKKNDLSNEIEQRITNILKGMIKEEFNRQNIDISRLCDELLGYPKVMYKQAA